MRWHCWLKHLFIIELWSQKWSSHTPARTTWWMYVSLYWAVLHHQWNHLHGLYNPFNLCHYLLFCEFFKLVIDSSQLGLCGSQMVDFLYQSRQTRCSILEDRAQEMGCFRKVWSTAFRGFMCLSEREHVCRPSHSPLSFGVSSPGIVCWAEWGDEGRRVPFSGPIISAPVESSASEAGMPASLLWTVTSTTVKHKTTPVFRIRTRARQRGDLIDGSSNSLFGPFMQPKLHL